MLLARHKSGQAGKAAWLMLSLCLSFVLSVRMGAACDGPGSSSLLAASLQDAICCAEYLLRARFRNHIALEPVLHVAPAKFRAGKIERVETQEGNRFGFNF